MKLAIILVVYNTPKSDLTRLQRELKKFNIKGKFYIYDNSKNNRGYAFGINKEIERAISERCDTFMILNTDIKFLKVSLTEIVLGLKKFDILGGVMYQKNDIYYGGSIDRWRLSGGLINKEPIHKFSPVDYVTGSMMIFEKNLVDCIGLMDEMYFMYYEDVDYAMRASKAGKKIGITKGIIYEHFENNISTNKEIWMRNNRLKFFKKNANIYQWVYELVRLPKTVIEEIFK
jgi:GT2 family glycosyltransferase